MSDLRGFAAPEPLETGNTGKIFGVVVIALAVCAAGTYSYETGMWNSRPIEVASNDVPPPVRLPAALAPAPQPMTAPTSPMQSVPAAMLPQAAAAPRPVETTRHVLAQRSPRAATIVAPAEPAADQNAPPEIPPQPQAQSAQVPTPPAQASPDSGFEPQPTAQPQQDTPAQSPPPQLPDNSAAQTPQ
jgi:hypothetical protein